MDDSSELDTEPLRPSLPPRGLRLKELSLTGFKSFADRTVFQFGGETLTGIVGPNGCGKSNVVDAARWVLGEQRPTSMRGKEMTDVIFKGCASRPGSSLAEVRIVLDNETGLLEGRGGEVEILRRVFKSGEGEYLIDGQRVRLKDVRELLFDTGLGSRGYSVLEQGRIDAVLSANPVDRRRIFEEAAGISRYRQRKHETELRLARAEQDIARIDDLAGELRTRVRSLKLQAGKAERFLAARAEWTLERRRLLDHQLHATRAALEQRLAEIAASESELAQGRAAREELEAALVEQEALRAELAAEVQRLASEASRLEGDGRALAERRHQLAARVAAWERGAEEEEQRALALEAELGERGGELERWRAERASLEGVASGASEKAEEHARERRELARLYREAREAQEAQNARVLELLHQRTEAANTLRHLELQKGPLEERAARVADRLAGVGSAAEAARVEEIAAADELERASSTLKAAEERRAARRARIEELERELAALEEERRGLALECARLTSRIEALLDRERELEDLDAGSRALFQAVQEGRGPIPPERMQGLVADHLRSSTRFARALDALLGARARALVLSDPLSALAVAEWLSGGDAGQASLTVPCGFGPPPQPVRPHVPSRLAARVIGPLRAEVECDPGYEPLAELVCENVLLVEDVATALELVRRAPNLVCVTPGGELVDAAGLSGGERALIAGAIGARASAAELEQEVRRLEAQGVGLEQRIAERSEERAVEREDLAAAEHALVELREVQADAQARVGAARHRARDLGAALAEAEAEARRSAEELERLARAAAEAALARERTQEEFERENALLQERERERVALEEERDRKQREEGLAQVELARLSEQLGALERRIADQERNSKAASAELERARRLARESAESARAGRAERDELAQRDALLAQERAGLEAELAQARARAGEAERALEAARARSASLGLELERASALLAEQRLAEQRVALTREEVLRRAQEDLGLSPQELESADFVPEPELLEPSALEALEQRVRALKQELDRLGPVNTEALAELEETGQRLEFLDSQGEDLRRARRALDETLARLAEESEKLFVATFEEVRANFQRIFRQLFGGGRADVKLAEGEPVLEAGVEIMARPPGREMLPIGLLSGGQRTMTALALLFAVFEARPSPFCILDEVDAALDDANIQRFLAMLEEFRRSTQFVVVTHNKGTMAACESLYGVTMEIKGVSRQVSVQLSEVDDFVPGAAGRPERAREGAGARRESDEDEEGARASARGSRESIDPESGEPIVELRPLRPEPELVRPAAEQRG